MPAKRHYTSYTKTELLKDHSITTRAKSIEELVYLTHVKFDDSDDPNSYTTCKHCGGRFAQIDKHLKKWHNQSTQEYLEQFPNSDLVCKNTQDKIAGENNPGYQHGGRLSAYSDKFVGYVGKSKEEIEKEKQDVIAKANQTREDNPERQPTRIEYYLAKGMTEAEAKVALSKRQSTFSLEKCIEKYGEETGNKIWSARQIAWHTSYKTSNYSKISQELFWSIVSADNKYIHARFAENNFGKMKEYDDLNNYEAVVVDGLKPDFLYGDKIIEFNGTYWHGAKSNPQREAKRTEKLLANGYEVFIVNEKEYLMDKNKAVLDCINFLMT